MSDRNFVTINDICDAFNVSRMTVYTWRKKLGLPHMAIQDKFSTKVLFNWESVTEWAKRNNKRIVKQRED